MATPTYTLIDSVTLGSSAASVTFSSIDQSFGDLVLVTSIKTVVDGNNFRLNFNGITSVQYSYVSMNGNGSSAYSAQTGSDAYIQDPYTNPPSGSFASYIAQIMDYSATDKHKSVLLRSSRADDNVAAIAGRWANTAAITSLTVRVFGADLATGSTFHLYGIAKAL